MYHVEGPESSRRFLAGAGRRITGRSSIGLSTFGWCSRKDGCGNRRKLCSDMLDVAVAAALAEAALGLLSNFRLGNESKGR